MIRRPPRSTLFPTRRSSDLELTYVYERDPAQAVTSRREVLALAAAMGVPIAAAHPHAALSADAIPVASNGNRSEEHTSELQSRRDLVCRLLLEKKKMRIAHT